MTSRADVDDFLAQRTLAVVGVSRRGRRFGNAAAKELRASGRRVLAVNRHGGEADGAALHASLAALPEPVDGVVIVVPPGEAEAVVRDALALGIRRVWLQQGSSSPAAIAAAREGGLRVVHGECILMFLEHGAFLHRAHRWVWDVLGKLPR